MLTKTYHRKNLSSGLGQRFELFCCSEEIPGSRLHHRYGKCLQKPIIGKTYHRVLAKGLNYSVAPKKFPVADYITATENAYKNLSSEKASQLRATMCSMLRKPAKLKVEQNLDRLEREALRDLKNDKSVTILPADKGRCAVVMTVCCCYEQDMRMRMLASVKIYCMTKVPMSNCPGIQRRRTRRKSPIS